MTSLVTRKATDGHGDYLIVTCGRGYEFTIDETDAPILGKHKWKCYKSRATFYVLRGVWEQGKGRTILLHREITEAPKGLTVDHIDWNGLNNRRYNLRLVTDKQNTAYVRPDKSRQGRVPISGYRGVYPTESGRWTVLLSVGNKLRGLGTYDTAEEAAAVWDAAAIAARGDGLTHVNLAVKCG